MFKENWTGWKWWLLQHQRYLAEEAVVRTGISKHFALQHNQMRLAEKEADAHTPGQAECYGRTEAFMSTDSRLNNNAMDDFVPAKNGTQKSKQKVCHS